MKYLVSFLFLFKCIIGLAQQTDYVDFKSAKADIKFGNLTKNEVIGKIVFEIEILKDIDSIFIDAINFHSIKYILDDSYADSLYNGKQLIIKHPFKVNTKHKIEVVWETSPKKAMYFIDWDYNMGNKQIWTQGQGKYTSNWLPSIDDMNEKIEFDLNITFHKDYEVISNGKLTNKLNNDSTITWNYDMQQPMSSYLVALAIGKYSKKVKYSKSGIPLEMYYYTEDSLKFEPTYRYTKEMFDFLEEEIGFPYPWQNYKQVPVKDFLYSGMENTSTTVFADSFVIDSIAFVDKNYVNVNAHELAHQWFGDLVTETSGTHHWLQEGFATYYALLAERDIFGNDYYYWRLYEYAQELLEQDNSGGSTSLLDPKSSSLTFYKKGAWVLHILREQVGEKAFKTAVRNYLMKNQFKNVETNDFIGEVEESSGKDLSNFSKEWLYSSDFKFNVVEKYLKKNKNLYDILKLKNEKLEHIYYPDFVKMNNENKQSFIIHKAASTENFSLFNQFILNAFKVDNIKVRQAIAQSVTSIPSELKSYYESLLSDKSYITIESALFNLWKNFPQDRYKYLNKTKGIQGFNDKNVRILWLTLALLTEDFETENKPHFFKELTDYTNQNFGFEIRKNAFQYLNQIQGCIDKCKENLNQATKHHNWRFSQFAKELLKE
ncbi:MAG: M1 family metallopeptidase [Flaviramulus sp.]|nr:M1 family metallopeptidase [Flaviramulus sp.]NNC50593.1 M1 family metallopeptidase [Flaviramulus sp.]